MSYQVIARKWRPPTFSELIGQNHIRQTLKNALKENRLPHAILFTGPRGTGKTSSARILAKSLRCTNTSSTDPCNSCNDCVEINNGSNLNVIEIDGASNNGVDSIRELREALSYMPSTGKNKIYIIDEVHMLSTSAFNALLKTLEEPPEHIVFIMATTEAHKVPHTILSRCQRFDFRRIPTATIAKSLSEICRKEGFSTSEEALWAIARQADGSMRDSQSLLDQIITFSGGELTYTKVIDALGLTDRHILLNTLEALVQSSPSAMLEAIDKMSSSGLDPKVFVQELLEEIRHLLVTKLSPPQDLAQMIDLPDSEIKQLQIFAEQLSAENVHLLFDMALKGANDLHQSTDPHLVLDMLLLRMASAPRIESFMQMTSPRQQGRTTTSLPNPSPTGSHPSTFQESSPHSKAPQENNSLARNLIAAAATPTPKELFTTKLC